MGGANFYRDGNKLFCIVRRINRINVERHDCVCSFFVGYKKYNSHYWDIIRTYTILW